VHRALNLSVPGFSNAARFLFRKFPEAIEQGRLRIYNSKVWFFLPSHTYLAKPVHMQEKYRSGYTVKMKILRRI
ncbi:MAG: hypothetical protein ACYSU5_10525, partial [Planctomycetota bacterium]|jgi:hypothetical protein